MLSTPVLFLVFNRPETTQRVFEQIRAARPRQLFIGADGPRADREGELEKCEQVRRIATNVDWDCEVKTLFRDNNLGCGIAVSEAITWFFRQVEEGIILEDDCLPSQSFFTFCCELLGRYRDDKRVYHISGTGWPSSKKIGDGDYFLTSHVGVWGWATWANRWKTYTYVLGERTDMLRKKISARFTDKQIIAYHYGIVQRLGHVDSWDYQWQAAVYLNDGVAIESNHNFISNIGFNIEATHTQEFNPIVANKPAVEFICDKWRPPTKLDSVTDNDIKLYRLFDIYTPSFIQRLFSKIKAVYCHVFSKRDY